MILLGVTSAAATMFLLVRMQAVDPWPAPNPAMFYWRTLRHHIYLLWEMLVSAVAVVRIILSPRMNSTAKFSVVPLSQKTPLGKLVRANSITLTPGTISTEMSDGGIVVHTLNAMPDDDKEQQRLDESVRALEKR